LSNGEWRAGRRRRPRLRPESGSAASIPGGGERRCIRAAGLKASIGQIDRRLPHRNESRAAVIIATDEQQTMAA